MKSPKLPAMPDSVPDIDWLMKMVGYLFERDFDAQAFNSFIDFSKGLNDAKRRLFFGMMGLVVYLKRRVAELGGVAPDIRPFSKYNWILEEFGKDPVANAKRELAGLPEGAGKDLEGADYNRIARVVRDTLGLNRPLDEQAVSHLEGPARQLPPPDSSPDEVPAECIDDMEYDLNPKHLLRVYVRDEQVRKWLIYDLNQCPTCEVAVRFILADLVRKQVVTRDTAHDRRFLEAVGAHLTHTKGHGADTLLDLVQIWIK